MKHLVLLKKVIPAAILFVLLLLVVASCKKKTDDNVTPTPTPTPTPAAGPNAFVPKTLHLMTEYEKSHNMRFPGYSNYLVHRGLVHHALVGKAVSDDLPNPLEELHEVLSKVKDYQQTQHEFAQIDNELENISSQLTRLTTEVNAYGNAILGEISIMTTLLSAENIKPSIENINNFWTANPGQWTTFMAFENAAASYERNPLNPDSIATMNEAQANVNAFATKATALYIWSNVTTIQGLINISGNVGILSQFAQTLYKNAQGSTLDSAQAMQYYMMLEGYFLNLIYSQSNAETMIINIDNVYDSTGGTAATDYNTKFAPLIELEVSAFLYAVDYLVANISEYRNTPRFLSDMNYANEGIAPDNVFIHVVARSQFLANILYAGLGLGYPVVSGYILTPHNYTNGTTGIVNQVTLNFQNNGPPIPRIANASTYASQIPYTYWVAGSTATCNADNQWNIYRVGTLGTVDVSWPGGTNIPVTIADNEVMTSPWTHYTPIQGNVMTMFYNPQNPDSTPSSTYSLTNNFQFGYFSVNWQWGYLYMSNFSTETNWLHTDDFTCNLYNTMFGWSGKIAAPQVLTTTKLEEASTHGTSGFNYPLNSCGTMQMTGNAISTPYYYIAYDCFSLNMQANSDPADFQSPDLQAWCRYSAMYNFAGSGGSDLWVTMGTNLYHKYQNSTWSSDGKIMNSIHYTNCPNVTNSNSGVETGIKRNTAYAPSFQYVYQTQNVGAVSATIQVNTSFQMIYTGFYLLSK
jgi:hypothetical protein